MNRRTIEMRYRGVSKTKDEHIIRPGSLTIVRGHQGSGKSTWAFQESARTGAIVIEGDDWRHPNGGLYLWSSDDDCYVVLWAALEARRWLRQGRDVIVVDVFEKAMVVRQIEAIAGNAARVVRMDGNYQNHHGVSEAEIRSIKDIFEPVLGEEII